MHLKNKDLLRENGYLGGAWRAADSSATLAVTNPATQALLGTVPNLGAAETKRAIAAAAKALPAWAGKTVKERSVILRRWFDLVMQHSLHRALLV